YVRHERNLPRTLDRRLQFSLVHRAGTRDAPRQNLPALGDERTDQLDVLIVDVVDLVRTELAHLSPAEERPALALRFVGGFLVAAATAAAAASRPSLSECHRLHSLVGPDLE